MEAAKISANEKERLKSLHEYGILDTLSEKEFDDITRLAAKVCQTSMAYICFIDEKRQWFKSCFGFQLSEIHRDLSIDAFAIQQQESVLMIPDTRADHRFSENPLITNHPQFVSYGAAALVTNDGYALGTLCVANNQPYKLNEEQLEYLKILSNQVIQLLELKKAINIIHHQSIEMGELSIELHNFASLVANEIKDPNHTNFTLTEILLTKLGPSLEEDDFDDLKTIRNISLDIHNLINGLLEHTNAFDSGPHHYKTFSLSQIIEQTLKLVDVPKNFNIEYEQDLPEMSALPLAMEQILLTLINNSIRFNDKPEGHIRISFVDDPHYYRIRLSDNGTGIPKAFHQSVFDMSRPLNKPHRFSKHGFGIGLYTVKRLVKNMGGDIFIDDTQQEGVAFEFTIKKAI